jgi:hypothetical protein
MLNRGFNVVVFDKLPVITRVLVINGDLDDLRFLDKRMS